MADDEKKPNSSDQIKRIDTPEKEREKNRDSGREGSVQLLTLLVVLLRLAQVATRSVRVRKNKNKGKRQGAFPVKGRGKIREKEGESAPVEKIYHFKSKRPVPMDLTRLHKNICQLVSKSECTGTGFEGVTFDQKPISSNIAEVKKLNEFMSQLLEENSQSS